MRARWPVATMVALALAGCGDDAAEQPRGEAPVPQITPASPAPDTATPTPVAEATAEPSPLAALRPCALVSAAEVRRLGLSDMHEKQVGVVRVCRWRYEGATLADSYTVGLELFETLGIDALVGDQVRPLPRLAGHRVVRFVDPAGSCVVAVATSPNSRVDATAVGGDRPHACRLALQVARAAAPRLP